jgi:hypothetical protein
MPSWTTGSHVLLLHVEVSIRILNITHVWTFLLYAQPLPSVGVLPLSAAGVVRFLASYSEVIEASA